MADIFPGARVVEAGVGSGALTCFLLRAVGPEGMSPPTSGARTSPTSPARTWRSSTAADGPTWRLVVGDLRGSASTTCDVDRVILDMLAPWECVDAVAKALTPGGVICCYVATTTQLSRTVETLRDHGEFHRAACVGDPGSRLARRGARRPARSPDDRPHRVPRHRPPHGRRRHPAAAASGDRGVPAEDYDDSATRVRWR